MSDLELLREYRKGGADEAFALLVERHLNMVYTAALRQVRSAQLAEEIAQSVFSDLAQSDRLKDGTVLSAWLYEVTRRLPLMSFARRRAARNASKSPFS